MTTRRKWKAPIKMPRLSPKAIGRRIRECRQRTGREWSMRDLARVAGMPYGTLSAFETGHRVPNRSSSIRLVLALGVTLDFLLLGKHAGKGRDKRE